jgi:tetratricopeptide (TPR) repeat protein
VLEGSVQRAGDRVRINAQLIDALDGGHVWADRFDGSIADVFLLQDKVTNSTADALAVRLSSSQQEAIAQTETNSAAAYDAFLHGWEHYRRTTPGDYAQAIPYFEKAIKLDPNYHRANAALAMVYVMSYAREWIGNMGITDAEARIRARQYLKIAQRHPTALAHQAAGYAFIERQAPMDAFNEFKQATELDPSDSWSYAFAALALNAANRPAEALPYIKTALRLDPRPPALFVFYQGLVEFNREQFDEAALSLERAGRLNPDDQYSFLVLAATYGYLGRRDDAGTAVNRYNELTVKLGGVPVTVDKIWWLANYCCAVVSDTAKERLIVGLRSAGVPESLTSGEFAEHRLSREEIHSLVFGRQLHGRPFRQTSENRTGSVTMDGVATFSGDWISPGLLQGNGRVSLKDNELCVTFGPANYCGIVLRNPGESRASENEFIWRGYPFSQVE